MPTPKSAAPASDAGTASERSKTAEVLSTLFSEKAFRWLALLAMLATLIYVALAPDRMYTPVARTVTFFLAGVSLALMSGAELANKLELKGPFFAVTLVSSAAIAIGAVVGLTLVAKPEEGVVAVEVVDKNGMGVPLKDVSLTVTPAQGATGASYGLSRDTLFVVFVSNVGAMKFEMRYEGGGTYKGEFLRPAHGRVRLQQGPLVDGIGSLTVVGTDK